MFGVFFYCFNHLDSVDVSLERRQRALEVGASLITERERIRFEPILQNTSRALFRLANFLFFYNNLDPVNVSFERRQRALEVGASL